MLLFPLLLIELWLTTVVIEVYIGLSDSGEWHRFKWESGSVTGQVLLLAVALAYAI